MLPYPDFGEGWEERYSSLPISIRKDFHLPVSISAKLNQRTSLFGGGEEDCYLELLVEMNPSQLCPLPKQRTLENLPAWVSLYGSEILL